MVNYICNICNKNFSKKDNFIKHTQLKKNPCKPIFQISLQDPPISLQDPPISLQDPPISLQNSQFLATKSINNNLTQDQCDKVKNNDFICKNCGKVFKRKDNLKRHIDYRCKVMKSTNENDDVEKINEIKDIVLSLKKDIISLKNNNETYQSNNSNYSNNSNNTNNINNVNNVTNNYIIPQSTLTNFGSEDLTQLPANTLHKILKNQGCHALVECFYAIHNNTNYPQGMNSFISDKSRNKGMIWKDGDWKQISARKLYNDVMNKIDDYIIKSENDILRGVYNTSKDPKGDKILKLFEQRFKKFYERYCGVDDTVSEEVSIEFEKMVKETIINELCNIKNSVIDNYKKILDDASKNDRLENKEEAKKNITENMNKLLNTIDHITEKTKNNKTRIVKKIVYETVYSSDSDE